MKVKQNSPKTNPTRWRYFQELKKEAWDDLNPAERRERGGYNKVISEVWEKTNCLYSLDTCTQKYGGKRWTAPPTPGAPSGGYSTPPSPGPTQRLISAQTAPAKPRVDFSAPPIPKAPVPIPKTPVSVPRSPSVPVRGTIVATSGKLVKRKPIEFKRVERVLEDEKKRIQRSVALVAPKKPSAPKILTVDKIVQDTFEEYGSDFDAANFSGFFDDFREEEEKDPQRFAAVYADVKESQKDYLKDERPYTFNLVADALFALEPPPSVEEEAEYDAALGTLFAQMGIKEKIEEPEVIESERVYKDSDVFDLPSKGLAEVEISFESFKYFPTDLKPYAKKIYLNKKNQIVGKSVLKTTPIEVGDKLKIKKTTLKGVHAGDLIEVYKGEDKKGRQISQVFRIGPDGIPNKYFKKEADAPFSKSEKNKIKDFYGVENPPVVTEHRVSSFFQVASGVGGIATTRFACIKSEEIIKKFPKVPPYVARYGGGIASIVFASWTLRILKVRETYIRSYGVGSWLFLAIKGFTDIMTERKG